MTAPGLALALAAVLSLSGCREMRFDEVVTMETSERFKVGECFVPYWNHFREAWDRPIIIRVKEIGTRSYRGEYLLTWPLGYGGTPTFSFLTENLQKVRCP